MSVPIEARRLLAKEPGAMEVLQQLADRAHKASAPKMTLASAAMTGVIPVENFRAAQTRTLLSYVADENERVLCARFGHELPEGVSPDADPLARKYLELTGALLPGEELPLDTN